MIFKSLLFVILIALSGILLLVSLIFLIIRLSENHPKKWNWLYTSLIAFAILVASIFFFVRKVVNTAKEFGETMSKQMEESFGAMDSLSSDFHYQLLDSSKMNTTIKQLKVFEEKNESEKAPDDFYVYLGFRDYYRMPLTFPYSLHCIDVLETASLFNEKYVVDYNTSDNGEIDCHLNGITAFAFDNGILIAKQSTEDKTEKFIIYDFKTEKASDFGSQKEAFSIAKKKFNYSGADTLINVMDYHRLFN